LTESKETVN